MEELFYSGGELPNRRQGSYAGRQPVAMAAGFAQGRRSQPVRERHR